jgi:hypothetical protein
MAALSLQLPWLLLLRWVRQCMLLWPASCLAGGSWQREQEQQARILQGVQAIPCLARAGRPECFADAAKDGRLGRASKQVRAAPQLQAVTSAQP